MSYPLIISFYTDDWKYPEYSERFKKDCTDLGLEFFVKKLDSKGGWLENTCLKPQFILDCLKEFKRPVLWLDIDTKIKSRPDLLIDFRKDFAACKMPVSNIKDLYVSVLAFNYNAITLNFIEKWISKTGAISDHTGFDEVWKSEGRELDTLILPSDYSHIVRHGEKPKKYCVFAIELSASESKKTQMAELKKIRGY